jgi:hypothetical protein
VAAPELVQDDHERRKARAAKVEAKYPEQYEDYGARFGADDCYFYGTDTLYCRDGKFSFEVRGDRPNSYGPNVHRLQREWREQVLEEVIRTLAAKMA